ncbi:MAG: peptide chain release factor 1 [Actinomycetota bacterium]
MSDPLRPIKTLPWRELLLIAGLTNLSAIALELFLGWGFTQSRAVRDILTLLYRHPFGELIPVLAAVGMGALAVYLFEQRRQQFLLNRASLWALAFCLLLGLLLKSVLPILPFLVSLSRSALVGIVVGVFWKGRPYWRG